MRMKIVFTILLLGLQQIDSSTDTFCYQNPECGPESWDHTYPTCNGTMQSPIDIKTNTTWRMDQLGAFSFQGYNESNRLLNITHTKKTIRVTLAPGMKVTGGGLPWTYLPVQFHLHWGGSVASGGSEHRLDGQQYGMELHIVHRREGINLTEAFSGPQGLAVMGFFIKIESNIQENPSWKNLTRLVKNLTEDGDELTINAPLSLMDLIGSVNLTKYFRYNGSLTTPECDEVVLWTIFQEPIRLNASLVETFFTDIFVNSTQGSLLLNTFRPTQQNVNAVWMSRDASSSPPAPPLP
ncbi:carbonic anhydrase 4-like, partial [Leucoraja erinacea]|uniref:carbonic anhydrase 4-like n=1 Tax=Leucoraja erinaceus TaxID=7782 RepID=UPI0024585C78